MSSYLQNLSKLPQITIDDVLTALSYNKYKAGPLDVFYDRNTNTWLFTPRGVAVVIELIYKLVHDIPDIFKVEYLGGMNFRCRAYYGNFCREFVSDGTELYCIKCDGCTLKFVDDFYGHILNQFDHDHS
jgi:hypothetical protein